MNKYIFPIIKWKIKPWLKYYIYKKYSKLLPDEYQQVDYIESSGTQYIDTDYLNTGTMVVYLVASVSKSDNQQGIFGATGIATSNSQLRLYTGQNGDVNKLQYNYGTQNPISYQASITGLDTRTKTKYTFGNGTFYINGNPYISYTVNTFPNAQKSTIFAVRSVSGDIAFLSSMKLYSLKITDNNELKRNFIPCYRKSDNVVGLYDLVNNVFYTNAGTGSFTYGGVV